MAGEFDKRVSAGPPTGLTEGQDEELGEFGGKIGKYVGVPDGYRTPGVGWDERGGGGNPRKVSTREEPRYDEANYNARIATLADSPEDVFRLQRKLAEAGLIGPRTRITPGQLDNATRSAYRKLVTFANVSGVDEQEAYTRLTNEPKGTAESLFGDLDGDGVTGSEAEEKPFTGNKTQTNRSVNLTDPVSAQASLRRLLREELGRAPRKDEVSTFLSALNGAERGNPSITTSTTSYVDGDATGTNSTTTGGLNAEAFDSEYLEGNTGLATERNTFRVATDYYDAAMGVLGEGGR